MKQVSILIFSRFQRHHRVLLFSVLAACMAHSQPAFSEAAFKPEGPLLFNVWLDQRKMGTHTFSFEQQNDKLLVTSVADFKLKVAFVTLFNYQHKALETWSGNCLTALQSNTTTNGKEEQVSIDIPLDECAGTYTYWDRQRLHRKKLTNAQTAKVEPAQWVDAGSAELPTIGKRKTITNPPDNISEVKLKTTSAQFALYYDADNNLLMMQTDNDGRTITYLLDSLTVK